MSYSGADFGFVGQSYEAPDPNQDMQRCINWFVEASQDEKSKTPTALLGAPGLNVIQDFNTLSDDIALSPDGGCRGCWVLPGGTQALVAVGSHVVLMTMTVPPTQTTIAQFSTVNVGTLLTNSGPVCIRDNGAGGYGVLVDGPYGYVYNIATGTFAQITDPDFLGADRVAFIDGWLIFNEPGTQNFYTNAPTPYTITFQASFFAKNDTSSDHLITLMENNRELWLIGERHSEVWYDAGGANFAFSRIPGVAPQIGCSAVHSIARLGSAGLVWLGSSERGQNVVIKTEQYSYIDISSRGIEHAISQYPLVSDAVGYTYEEEGHLFYVLTFPTADKTWVYDHTASEALGTPQWHERASYDPATGVFHRHKSNCFMNFQNIRMVGDFQEMWMYQMSRAFYQDGGSNVENGTPLIAIRRCPHLWSKENRERLFHSSLQVEFTAGVGLQTGQGVNPQAMMRFSDDSGANFGTIRTVTIGAAGRTKNRAMWRRLGEARDRVYEVSISDPVKRDVVGATLYAEATEQVA
jgi:hypothetical protein